MKMDVKTLRTDGYVAFDRPAKMLPVANAAMSSWQRFCALPLEEKRIFSGGDRVKDFGYMLRQDTGPNADAKELFHVKRVQIKEMHALATKVRDRRATEFISAVDALIAETIPIVRLFARGVQETYALPGFAAQVLAAQDQWIFRYVHYLKGEVLANAHPDRGGFTLHLNETHEGGEYLTFGGEWRPWLVSAKRTVIFPSMGLQHLSKGELKALYHRVVANPETRNGGRCSMVAFIDFFNPWRYDDSVKRLQDFPHGFNYKMPFAAFDKLFVPNWHGHA